ncbi:hepatocellular carcinoma-associated antigen 66, partial [Corynespora cassiicola Philippines]
MSGPSDKARFYLEQSATELDELERKKIFSREEISSIARKRSDFEHIINARGSSPSDYVRYIDFEKNVDALRRKRIKRLGVRYKGSGQRTIYFLYNRGTKKFPGDLGLWMQYIEFARKDKAFKRLNDIFTSVVRLHPTKPDLWVYAANYFMETQADITNARSYMQRGLRFCKHSELLWLEYAKLETIYIGKIAGRRKILGLDDDMAQKKAQESGDFDSDMIALPDITAEDVNPSLGKDDGVDEEALRNMKNAPILTGAIPMAVFDSAMKEFQDKPEMAGRFFDMFAEFDQLPCARRLLQHVLDHLQQNSSSSIQTAICAFRMRLFGIHPTSPEFPSALRDSLDTLNQSIQSHPHDQARISEAAVRHILPLMRTEDMDVGVSKALSISLRKYCRLLEESGTGSSGDVVGGLAERLLQEKHKEDAEELIRRTLKLWGSNERISQLRASLE